MNGECPCTGPHNCPSASVVVHFVCISVSPEALVNYIWRVWRDESDPRCNSLSEFREMARFIPHGEPDDPMHAQPIINLVRPVGIELACTGGAV